VSEAHWVVAQLAQAAGNEMLALDEARLAHKQRPSWDAPGVAGGTVIEQDCA